MSQKTSIPRDFDPNLAARNHKRQRFWQIILPILVVTLLGLAVAVLLAVSSGEFEQLPQLAHTSTVMLVLPLLFLMILLLVILVLLIVLVANLTQKLPGTGEKVLLASLRLKQVSRTAADLSVKPIFKVNETLAGIKSLNHSLLRKRK
jgi:ABC-type uncharacterized transport system fused permease/ATPase subunit